MITLKEACNIIRKELGDENILIIKNCKDFGDSWVFEWGWRNSPNDIRVGLTDLRVYKKDGALEDFPKFGIPNDKEFELMKNAPVTDVSEYLTCTD